MVPSVVVLERTVHFVLYVKFMNLMFLLGHISAAAVSISYNLLVGNM